MTKAQPALCLLTIAAAFTPGRAHACGGFFCNQPQPGDPPPVAQSGENVLFAVDLGETASTSRLEAHVQIFYQGPADKFSWIVPVTALPTLDVGTNVVFNTLATVTTPDFTLDWRDEGICRETGSRKTGSGGAGHADGAARGGAGGSGGAGGGVDVAFRGDVGPYDAAVVKSDDPAALETWLTDNGYFVSPEASEIIGAYVAEQQFFVALKLINGRDVQEIQPIVLRFAGDMPCVPLRLTAIASVDDLPVNLWVLGKKRAVPKNYLELEINIARLDWFAGGGNYRELVRLAANEAGGNAFIAEYAGPATVMTGMLWQPGRYDTGRLRQRTTPPAYLDEVLRQGIPRDSKLLGLFRKYIPEPQALVAQGVTERDFYNSLEYYWQRDKSAFIPFDPEGLTAEIDALIFAPLRSAQDLFDKHAYLTKLATYISPYEMLTDPMFIFNGALPDVPAARVAKAVRLCGNRAYDACQAPVRLELPDGQKLLFASSFDGEQCWGWNYNGYERRDLDRQPSLSRAWQRDDATQGAVRVDNSKAIAGAVRAHNDNTVPFLPAPQGRGCSIEPRGRAWGIALVPVVGIALLALRVRRRRG